MRQGDLQSGGPGKLDPENTLPFSENGAGPATGRPPNAVPFQDRVSGCQDGGKDGGASKQEAPPSVFIRDEGLPSACDDGHNDVRNVRSVMSGVAER